MVIAGIQKTTLIDYPGKVGATVFLAGCNFRCPWCYSSELVILEKIEKGKKIPESEFWEFLDSKKGLLQGIVVCGGEPTINNDLPEFLGKIKEKDFLIKLDTNGSNPEMLSDLISKKIVDYVAMDIKSSKEKYYSATGEKADIKKIEESVSILKEGKVDYEFRTTVCPAYLNKKDILEIAKWLSGAKRYYLQNFRADKNIDSKLEGLKPYNSEYLLEIKKEISPFFEFCAIR
jgi:pyruvate formate lyase activating enzyme